MDSKSLSLLVVAFVLMAVAFTTTTVSAVSEEDAAAAVPGKEPASVDRNDMKKFLEIMEKMDVDQILNNTRLMKANVKCFMNEGPCTAQLNEMKKMTPLLIKDACSLCTKQQKIILKKSIDKIKAIRPNEYEKLSKFFDPEGIHEKKFYDAIAKTE